MRISTQAIHVGSAMNGDSCRRPLITCRPISRCHESPRCRHARQIGFCFQTPVVFQPSTTGSGGSSPGIDTFITDATKWLTSYLDRRPPRERVSAPLLGGAKQSTSCNGRPENV